MTDELVAVSQDHDSSDKKTMFNYLNSIQSSNNRSLVKYTEIIVSMHGNLAFDQPLSLAIPTLVTQVLVTIQLLPIKKKTSATSVY